VIVAVVMEWGIRPTKEIVNAWSACFVPRAAGPHVGAAELLQVPHRQVEHFGGGVFGGELAGCG